MADRVEAARAWIRTRPAAARAAYDARSRGEQIALIGLADLLTFGILLRLGLMYTVRPALLGYTDTPVYINAAQRLGLGEWFGSRHQPNGYPMFIHLANMLSPKTTSAHADPARAGGRLGAAALRDGAPRRRPTLARAGDA